MRSELVFRAGTKVGNRYLLCQATARTTRCLHFVSANTSDAITDALVRMAGDSTCFRTGVKPTTSQTDIASVL
jgi:hypothetical protein